MPNDLKIDSVVTDDTDTVSKITDHIKTMLPSADIVSGGFPCKPWSTIGKCDGAGNEKYGNLGFIMCLIIKALQPKAFLIENVDGLTNKRNMPYFLKMIEFLADAGFNVQTRKRVFIVGIRTDIKNEFVYPLPSTEEQSSKPTIREVLADLPISPNGINEHTCVHLRKDEIPFVDKIPPCGNWRNLSIEDQKAFIGNAFYSTGGRTGALRKVNLDLQAYTILSTPLGKTTAQIVDHGINEPRRSNISE